MPSYHMHGASWRVHEQKVDVNSPGLTLVESFQPSVLCFPLFLPKSCHLECEMVKNTKDFCLGFLKEIRSIRCLNRIVLQCGF